MSNRWVISWLVIDYWRWSMSNRWLIEAQKFCGLSITHRWHRLLIDVIDYLLMLLITHRWLIDYSSTIPRNKMPKLEEFLAKHGGTLTSDISSVQAQNTVKKPSILNVELLRISVNPGKWIYACIFQCKHYVFILLLSYRFPKRRAEQFKRIAWPCFRHSRT